MNSLKSTSFTRGVRSLGSVELLANRWVILATIAIQDTGIVALATRRRIELAAALGTACPSRNQRLAGTESVYGAHAVITCISDTIAVVVRL
ncbi:MAG: hypothetical protein MJE77_45730 [Proteobacteria bacterium]|nr:hypothetical protein [Pseudomonadota bacterium]